ncbi:Ankyrin-3 [Ilyonectria robusta]
MLGALSKLRRSTRSKRRPPPSKSRRSRPVSSHGASSSGLKPPPGSSSRRARSHETERRRSHAGTSGADTSGADPYYDDHASSPRRRDTRRRSVSPRPRPGAERDSRSRRTRARRDVSISTDDDTRPLSPRYPVDRYARRGSQQHADYDGPSAHSRPVLKPYSLESPRFDDRRRQSHDGSHTQRPVARAYKSSSPAASPPRHTPSPRTQPEPLRGRPRSHSRDDARKPRPSDAAALSHPVDKPARKPKPKPKPRPPAESSTQPSPNGGGGDFLNQLPKALATFTGLKVLTDHADSAKEWADWLNDLHGAPEEIQALSAKATTAKDTITQIQRSLEARPDLVEGESGQILKQQIESGIKSADKALGEMTELLEDLGNDGTEGTVWKGLQDFYNSYRYKNEWEEKIKEAEVNLQKELATLSTLMVNIYSPPSPSVLAYEEATIGTELAPLDPPVPPAPATPEQPTTETGSKSPEAPINKEREQRPLPHSREDWEDALLNAAWKGDVEGTKRALLQVSPMTRDLRGLTPLHLTVQKDHLALAMLLLDRRVDCDARAKTGVTPLHLAARFASAATVEFLLEKGHADPNSRRNDGRTPLHYAAGAAVDGDEEARDVIRVLRDWGADPTVEDDKRRTPRDIAQSRDHWDAAATLRRAEKLWEDEHPQSWFQRHGFKK